MPDVIAIRDASTRAEIEAAIGEMRRRQMRMPEHWVERRAEAGDVIDELVDRWLEATA